MQFCRQVCSLELSTSPLQLLSTDIWSQTHPSAARHRRRSPRHSLVFRRTGDSTPWAVLSVSHRHLGRRRVRAGEPLDPVPHQQPSSSRTSLRHRGLLLHEPHRRSTFCCSQISLHGEGHGDRRHHSHLLHRTPHRSSDEPLRQKVVSKSSSKSLFPSRQRVLARRLTEASIAPSTPEFALFNSLSVAYGQNRCASEVPLLAFSIGLDNYVASASCRLSRGRLALAAWISQDPLNSRVPVFWHEALEAKKIA